MKASRLMLHILLFVLLTFSLASCASHPARKDPPQDRSPAAKTFSKKDGWLLVETCPTAVRYRVLLLPGLLCTDTSYSDLLDDARLADAGVKLVAGNPPGFKGVQAREGFDYSIESYAAEVEDLASLERFDLIAGHSFSGNVLIEVAARGRYEGKIMLLSPSLRRASEEADMRLMSRLVHIPGVGTFSMWASYQMMGSFYRPCMGEEKHGRVSDMIDEGQKTPVTVATAQVETFFGHIDRYGNLTERLISSRNQVWYVRGDLDGVILFDEDRSRLGQSSNVAVKDIPGGRHFIMIDRPSEVSALILDMLSGSRTSDPGALPGPAAGDGGPACPGK
jgi:pimeloyl-ACP methyl ester carboxylesterase